MVWTTKELGFDYQHREKLYLYPSICLLGTILTKHGENLSFYILHILSNMIPL